MQGTGNIFLENCRKCEAGKFFMTKMYTQYIAGIKNFLNEADAVVL